MIPRIRKVPNFTTFYGIIFHKLSSISHQIKKFRKDLPIIVQTAYAMPEDREKSLAAGGDEHLTKPINADELFKTINKFLN